MLAFAPPAYMATRFVGGMRPVREVAFGVFLWLGLFVAFSPLAEGIRAGTAMVVWGAIYGPQGQRHGLSGRHLQPSLLCCRYQGVRAFSERRGQHRPGRS